MEFSKVQCLVYIGSYLLSRGPRWLLHKNHYLSTQNPSLSQPLEKCLLHNDHRGPRLNKYDLGWRQWSRIFPLLHSLSLSVNTPLDVTRRIFNLHSRLFLQCLWQNPGQCRYLVTWQRDHVIWRGEERSKRGSRICDGNQQMSCNLVTATKERIP